MTNQAQSIISATHYMSGAKLETPLYFDGRKTTEDSGKAKVYPDGGAVQQRHLKKLSGSDDGLKWETTSPLADDPVEEDAKEEPITATPEPAEPITATPEPAEPAEPTEEENEEKSDSTMTDHLRKAKENYVHTLSHSGKKSMSCGDEFALLISGKSPDECVAIAEVVLNMKPGELADKYKLLNPGQKRMNSGNRVRAAIKREEVTIEQIEAAISKVCAGENK